MTKKEECKIKIKRDFLGRPKEVITKGPCSKNQVESALKKEIST